MATAVTPERRAARASPGGLTEAEAAARLARRGHTPRQRSSRSYASIVRANVFTVFNLILAVAGAATLAFGEWQDALFLGVLVSNSAIGIFQEVRAKRALDRLSALVAPEATVVRDGKPRTIPPLLPRQLTLAASLTIGIPGFFLALAPSSGRYSSTGFLRELARFALPAGTAAGLGVLSSYVFALNVLDLDLVAARTVAVTVLVLVGLYLILALEVAGRVRGAAVATLCLVLLLGYTLVLLVPFARDFFSLAAPSLAILAPSLAGAAIAVAVSPCSTTASSPAAGPAR